MSMILYTAEASIGVVSHIAMEESGLDYELVALDFSKKEQASAEYLKVNSKARVPSLKVAEGIITETPAILNYLAQVAPESPLGLPADLYQQARIQSFNAYLCSTVHVAHAHKKRGSRWVDDLAAQKAMTDNVPNTMAACFKMIETEMFEGPWVHGTTFSISDPYLYRISSWAEGDGVDISNYPKIHAHLNAMSERESVKAYKAYFNA